MACYGPSMVPIRRKGSRVSYLQEVPCGHCLGCRAEQARQWSVRIMHEQQMHDFSWFVTLTYSDENIPDYGSLDPQDFRGFIRALRREHKVGSISYFGCGEYGELTQRPHYHAVLFGPEFLDRYVIPSDSAFKVWRSASLERFWPHGLSELGTVTRSSASYVAGYVRKKVARKVNGDHYTRVDPDTGELVELEKEFSRMSLRPAIGKRWLRRYWQDVYPRDFVVVDGGEYKPPRYYDKLMDEDCGKDEPCFAGSCEIHKRMMMEVREKRYEEMEDLDEYTLNAKRVKHERRIEMYGQRVGI